MKIQPRQQLLEIWRAAAKAIVTDGEWVWGGRDASSSISDAEQLLCLMYPASVVSNFRLDSPDETSDDVLAVLRELGDAVEIPRRLTDVIRTYVTSYTDDNGAPVFSGGSYFGSSEPGRDPTPDQVEVGVVDSYSMSVTLMLATIGFIRVFRSGIRADDLRRDLDELEAMASSRLTAAMVSLLRSFTVHVFAPDSAPGRTLIGVVNRAGVSERIVIADLQRELREIRAGIRDLTIGSGLTSELDNPNRLFECGWSWGVVKDAPEITTPEDIGPQPKGVAQPHPYLYFTVIALDGIADLFSSRTTILGLLNEEQVRLAQALRLRWELTQQYWSIIGGFGRNTWPLEDIPWRTTDGKESDYYSLLVSSMVVQNFFNRRATDAELRRVGNILEELAERGRITRRATSNDPAISLHAPGVEIDLIGSEDLGGPRLSWQVSDFAAILLKRTIALATMARGTDLRDAVLSLADDIWDHVERRRIQSGKARNLWDQPSNRFTEVKEHHDRQSWYYTERVVECLVVAAQLVGSNPLRSARLTEHALDLVNEAEHLFDNELLNGSSEAGPAMRDNLQRVQASLVRARELLQVRPGTAAVLASEVLRELDGLNVARRDATGAS
ncbi:MAG: hypothetical protein JWN52_3043 [Actinomycetia bacterium]|nr:hypothetical protein [Actinomycetes bacterium]